MVEYDENDEVVIKDVSHIFEGCVRAEQSADSVLILYKLDKPRVRLDGKRASYELEYRWLSQYGTGHDDEVCCVQGSEVTLWQAKEINFKKNLFQNFQLF